MSSRDGAARADIDTKLFDDDKVRRLARLYNDSSATATAMTLYVATVLASWRENRALSIVEAAPAWYLDDPATVATGLITVGLLDAEGRVPEATLDTWMSRYRASVAGGIDGANRRWGGSRGPNGGPTGGLQGGHRGPNAQTDRMSVSRAPEGARVYEEPTETFGELMKKNGIKL